MTDYREQRMHMVDSQVRPNGITDQRIIAAMSAVPRETFVPQALRSVAHADTDLPLKPAGAGGPARHMLAPMVLARLIQLAMIRPGSRVLHVGAGTGYATAVLAMLGETVIAVEEDSDLLAEATARLQALAIANASVHAGRLSAGRSADGPYDVILVDGRIAEVPSTLLQQLADRGRLVAPIGETDVARATVMTNRDGTVSANGVFDMKVAPLPGFEIKRPTFVF